MDYIIIILAFATFLSTLIGGLIVIKYRRLLPFFFAFAAGSLVAVVFLDLLPEAIQISEAVGVEIRVIMLIILASFFVYNLIEKYFATHELTDCDNCDEHEKHIDAHDAHGHIMGPIGAGSLVVHSFLDGVAIGAAYLVNPAIGLIVAFAAISHDFNDGINTVTVMLKNKQNVKKAFGFLVADALAPVIGVLITFIIIIPEIVLAYLLAIFIGEFLYIGASTLLPEVHKHPSKKMLVTMALGMIIIAILTSLIAF